MAQARKFEAIDASELRGKPKNLLIGITGPQFSGKSYSAGRLATGIQRVVGRRIYWADTENDRALELEPYFNFRHVAFDHPQSPQEYIDMLDFVLAQEDLGVLVIDQMSHEHVAVLDMIEAFLEEKCGSDWQKRDRMNAAAQIRPKAMRKRLNEKLVYRATGTDGRKIPIILLYRALDKSKPGKAKSQGGDGGWVHQGWQAETTSVLPYNMTARFLLPPGSEGRPNLAPDTEWERLAIRNPQQFKDWFVPGFQLDEALGERLARWAAGEPAAGAPTPAPKLAPTAPSGEEAALVEEIKGVLKAHGIGSPRASAEPVLLAFGTTWANVTRMNAEALRAGLATLQKNLDGLAAMKAERQPGAD